MLTAYPIILHPFENGFIVSSPDFDIDTQGKDIAEAIYMARDAIGLTGITLQDIGQSLPNPSSKAFSTEAVDIVTYVDVDFNAYRASLDQRTIRKNCTIPSWLNAAAEKENINFSEVLQNGLMQRLDLYKPPVRGNGLPTTRRTSGKESRS